MQANELMIGDWVKYGREYFQVDGYFRITNTLCLKYNGKSAYYRDGEIVAEDSEPIPLTLEILEKNGFKQDDSFFENVADGYSCEFLIWHYYAEDIIISYDASEELSITYNMGHPCNEITLYRPNVHELQHALRLCGLHELADNFKID